MRSKPTTTALASPRADQPGRGAVDDQLVRDAGARQLPRRSAARPGAADGSRTPARGAPDRGRPCAMITPSALLRVPQASAPVLQCVSTRVVPASRSAPRSDERRSGGRVLGLDGLGLGASGRPRAPPAPPPERRGAHAVHGPRQVRRGRARGRAAAPARARARPRPGSPRDLHGQPVAGDDADQRRAPDDEAADRVRRVGRARRAPRPPRARAARSGRARAAASRPSAAAAVRGRPASGRC